MTTIDKYPFIHRKGDGKMKEERMTVEKSRCINCKYCECRDEDQYFCVAKTKRGKMLNSYRTILREANGRDFPYFCPLPENRKIIEDDIARRKDQHENRLINRVETCARDLVFALMEADIVRIKWEPAMELHGKKYRLEWYVIEEGGEKDYDESNGSEHISWYGEPCPRTSGY